MKKGQLPEGILILLVVAMCGMSLYYASAYSAEKAKAIDIGNAVTLSNDEARFKIYSEQAASLAMQQAFSEIAKKPISCNQQVGTAEVWSSSCKPNNQEIKNNLKKRFDEKLSALFGNTFTSEIGDKITVNFNPISKQASNKNKFFEYRISREYSPEISIEYPQIIFEEIYNSVVIKKEDCEAKLSESPDKMVSVRNCLLIAHPEWEFDVDVSGKYYIINLNTKKYYLYDGKFFPVEMKFAIG